MPKDADLDIIEAPVRPRYKPEIVVISDDEDVENQPPQVFRRRRTRPLSIDSSSSGSPVAFDETDAPPQPRHHVSKRQKADRGSVIPERTRLAPLSGDNSDYTKVKLSFMPDGSLNNLLFNTGEASRVPPQKSLLLDRSGFVQGSACDSFTTAQNAVLEDQCPWYYDLKYGVKMYRGLGYKRFPVVLGTVKAHKAICDRWEAHNNEQHEEDQLYIAGLSGGVNPFTITKTQNAARLEKQCWQEVQAIFPQIQEKFVLEKYRARCVASDTLDSDVAPSAIEIISEIAELDSYPKEESLEEVDEVAFPEDGTGVTVAYKKNTSKDETYLQEALRLLAEVFTHVPTITINRALHEKKSLFEAFTYFIQAEATYFDVPRNVRPYTRSKQPRVFLEKKYQRGFCVPKDSDLYINLINELQAAKQHDARESYRFKRDQDKETAEAQNLLQHKLEGSLIECQTCFDDEIPMNRAVMCEGEFGHFFCFGCVARLAESQIGAMKHEMMCMDGSGCKANLSIEGVGRAVATKVIDKLAFYAQQAEITAAGIEGLEQCPHCEFKAICDPVEEDCVFLCQNSDCGKHTCRRCQETAHTPKTCEEAKKDRGLCARHLVEEARSEAMMRKCPKCKAKIIKELGCNKMVCSCGNMMCYVCQQDISGQVKDGGYQHFHKAGSKCPLYDAQGTERHDEDANAAEKEAIEKVKAQEGNGDLNEKDLAIETGKDKPKVKKFKNPNHGPYADFANFANGDFFVPPGFLNVIPGLPGDVRQLPVAPDAQGLHRAQRQAELQRQMVELRAEADQIQRARDALDARRLENMNRAAQDAQDAAKQAQENINRIIGARQLYQMNAFALGPGGMPLNAPAGGQFNPFELRYQVPLLAPPPPSPQQQPTPQWHGHAVPYQQDVDGAEELLFGARTDGNGIARVVQRRDRDRDRNRDAAQEDLENLGFEGYAVRANGLNRR